MSDTITATYDVVAVCGAFLSVYVMQKTEHDQINMVDAIWLQWLRRAAFTLVSLVLLYSIYDRSELVMLVLVSGGVGNLTINAIALHRRSAPPQDRLREGARKPRLSKTDKLSQWRISPEWPAE